MRFKEGDLIKYEKYNDICYKVIKKIEGSRLWGITRPNPMEAIQLYKQYPEFNKVSNPKGMDTYFDHLDYNFITIINGYNTPLYKALHGREDTKNND